jgi:pimeloyl-ACP methyl ester carboxylesterase
MITPLAGGATVGLALAAVLFAMDRVALAMIRPPKQPHRRKVEGLPFESRRHSFSSSGQALQGWVVEPEIDSGGSVVVLAHGWGSSHANLIRLAVPLLQAGHPVLLFDIRHHGESFPARYVTARHYRDDILEACREISGLFPGRPVALIGHSMGGSTGILAAVEGAPVQGLISISAPADLWEVWAYYFDRKGLPGKWVVRILNPFWRARAGVPFRTLDPASRARELAIPCMILHGSLDESVPAEHATVLSEATGTKAVIMDGLDHGNLLDSEELHGDVLSFLDALSPPAPS